MQEIAEVIKDKQLSTDNCKETLNNNCQLTTVDIDTIMEDTYENHEVLNEKFHAWYCKRLRAIGSVKWYQYAQSSKNARSPARLFSSLIKSDNK